MLGFPIFSFGGVLSFLSLFMPCCLLPFLSEEAGAGAGAGAGGGVRVKIIGHGVWVRWEAKAKGVVRNAGRVLVKLMVKRLHGIDDTVLGV